MQIRTPRPEDCAQISAMLRETFQKLNSKDYSPEQIAAWVKFDQPEKIRARLAQKELRHFLAIDQNEVVGYLCVSTANSSLNSLYIKANQTGKGIGSELLEFAEMLVRSHGHKSIKLNASKTAVIFYKRKGYLAEAPRTVEVEQTKIPVIAMTKTFQ